MQIYRKYEMHQTRSNLSLEQTFFDYITRVCIFFSCSWGSLSAYNGTTRFNFKPVLNFTINGVNVWLYVDGNNIPSVIYGGCPSVLCLDKKSKI